MAHGIGLASIHNSMQRLRQPAGPVLGSTPAPPAIWGQEAPNMHCTQRGEGQSLRRTYSNSGLRPGSGLTRNLRPPSQTAGPVLAGLRHQRYLSTAALKETPDTKRCMGRKPGGWARAAVGTGRPVSEGTHWHHALKETWEKTQGEDDVQREQVPTSPRQEHACVDPSIRRDRVVVYVCLRMGPDSRDPQRRQGPWQTRVATSGPVFFSGERVAGRGVKGRAHCSEVRAPELPPMKEARAEVLPFAQRGPQTQETVE